MNALVNRIIDYFATKVVSLVADKVEAADLFNCAAFGFERFE